MNVIYGFGESKIHEIYGINVLSLILWIFQTVTNVYKPASRKTAWVILHKLFEPIFVQLFIFHVKVFVFFHISFVFKCKLTSRSIAVEVSCFLTLEWAVRRAAIFLSTKPGYIRTNYYAFIYANLFSHNTAT